MITSRNVVIIFFLPSFCPQPKSAILDVESGNRTQKDAPSTSKDSNVWEIPRHSLVLGDLKESGRFSEVCLGKVHMPSGQQAAVLVKRAKGRWMKKGKLAGI